MSDRSDTESMHPDHLSWVRTRLSLERDFRESVSRGFALIVAGFGSFAVFDGLAVSNEHEDLPKSFALIATAIGIGAILLGVEHYRKMITWVDEDEFGHIPTTSLPDEQRPMIVAVAAAIIGAISFVALLLTR